MPEAAFFKRLLSADEIIAALDNMMHRLFLSNSKVNILFTVSPVRYARDGVVENNLSKAILLQAVHHLREQVQPPLLFSRIRTGDRRPARLPLLGEDLVHPNDLAIQYVWEHFVNAYVLPPRNNWKNKCRTCCARLQHRALSTPIARNTGSSWKPMRGKPKPSESSILILTWRRNWYISGLNGDPPFQPI